MPTKSHVKSFPSGRVGNDRIDAVQRQFGEYPIEFRGEREHFVRAGKLPFVTPQCQAADKRRVAA